MVRSLMLILLLVWACCPEKECPEPKPCENDTIIIRDSVCCAIADKVIEDLHKWMIKFDSLDNIKPDSIPYPVHDTIIVHDTVNDTLLLVLYDKDCFDIINEVDSSMYNWEYHKFGNITIGYGTLKPVGNYLLIENKIFDGSPVYTSYSNYDSVIIRNCVYKNLHSNTYGTVLDFSDIGTLRIENCEFRNVTRDNAADRHALNIKHNINKVIIKNTNFYDICADGIQLGQSIYLDNSRYINYVLIEGCNFINDPSKSAENGIDWKGGCTYSGLIKDCYFSGFKGCNHVGCTGDAGTAFALHYKQSQNVTILNCIFENNNYGFFGGAGSGGDPRAPENITIDGNKFINSKVNMWECIDFTFQNNIVYGSNLGVTIDSIVNIKLRNNTIVNCTTNGITEYEHSYGTIDYSNNLNVGCTNSMDIKTGVANVVFETMDEAGLTNDFHLLSNSLAINAGVDNGLLHDIDGDIRDDIDIGADEYIAPLYWAKKDLYKILPN